MKKISIAQNFSKEPGPRFIYQGPFSGELFRKETLEPLYKKAREDEETIEVDLDGTAGYATSFLEEAFGGLARIYSPEEIARDLTFISNEEPYLIEEVYEYIRDANLPKE